MTFIDTEEMAVRIAESCMSNKRPAGMSAREAMDQLRQLDPETAASFERAALAAAEYIAECVNENNPGQIEVVRVPVSKD